MDAAHAFAPLDGRAPDIARLDPERHEFEPLPVPEGSEPPAAHRTLGPPSARWAYFDADGRLQGYVCRFDPPGRFKETRPLRYGRLNGREGWHWRGWDDGRPLYNLPDLLTRPDDPVLVVEGEKTASAAGALLPKLVAITSMNGAKSARKTDWAPLAGRDVVIWPDNDEPGDAYAREAAARAKAAGAKSVRIVTVPDGAPEGWDLADDFPEGWSEATVQAAIDAAEPFDPAGIVQGTFKVLFRMVGKDGPGLYG